MDSRSDDWRVPDAGEAALGYSEEAAAASLTLEGNDGILGEASSRDDEPCFTEAELNALLPPIPDWARKPPVPAGPLLFDDE